MSTLNSINLGGHPISSSPLSLSGDGDRKMSVAQAAIQNIPVPSESTGGVPIITVTVTETGETVAPVELQESEARVVRPARRMHRRELEAQNCDLRAEVQRAHSDLETLEAANADLTARLRESEGVVAQLFARIELTEKDVLGQEKRAEAAEARVGGLVNEVATLNQSETRLSHLFQQQLVEWRTRVWDSVPTTETKFKEIADKQSKQTYLELKKAQDEIAAAKNLEGAMRTAYDCLDRKMDVVKKQNEQLVEQVKKLEAAAVSARAIPPAPAGRHRSNSC